MNDTAIQLHESEPVVTPPSALIGLIDRAVEKGLDAEQLGKLMDLAERWEAKQAQSAFNEAMSLAQSELRTVQHTSKNSHTGSTYADLAAVVKAVNDVCPRHGLALSFYEGQGAPVGQLRICCDVTHKAGHTATRYLDLPLDGIGSQGGRSAMNPLQGKGSSISYGRRYLTCMVFNIGTADDTDGVTPDDFVDAGQIETIEQLIKTCEKAGNPVDFPRFLAWLGVENVSKLTQTHFKKAVHDLERKAKQKKGAAK